MKNTFPVEAHNIFKNRVQVNPSFSLRNFGQFVCLKFEQAYLEHINSKLGDSCSSGQNYKSFTSFIHNTFSFKVYFMLKYLVQHNHASFDQFYQNGYISCFTDPMRVKLVPNFLDSYKYNFHEDILAQKCTQDPHNFRASYCSLKSETAFSQA